MGGPAALGLDERLINFHHKKQAKISTATN
jgi:hypothetical protein